MPFFSYFAPFPIYFYSSPIFQFPLHNTNHSYANHSAQTRIIRKFVQHKLIHTLDKRRPIHVTEFKHCNDDSLWAAPSACMVATRQGGGLGSRPLGGAGEAPARSSRRRRPPASRRWWLGGQRFMVKIVRATRTEAELGLEPLEQWPEIQ